MSRADLVRRVFQRAEQRCEYCQMHQALQGATFHIEHVIPYSLGGADDEANLAVACPSCNLHKADRIVVPDPDSTALVNLFNPRQDRWSEHFRWEGVRIIPLTATGRAASS